MAATGETGGGAEAAIGPATPLTPDVVHALHLAGAIPAGRYLDAVRFARDDAVWARWGRRAVLALGVGQVLAGVLFFFAYNWAALPAFAKLGGLQAAIAAVAIAAWAVGPARPIGRALLIAAAVLVGVTLAVYGQIYQTGADAYQLFVGWALLILPWVLVSASAPLWLVWLAVAHVGVELYGVQIAIPEGRVSWAALHAGLALFDTALLAAREVAVARGRAAWLRAPWTRRVLLALALAVAGAPALREVFEGATPDGALAVAVFVGAVLAAGAVYARPVPDFAAFALVTLFGCLFLSAIAIDFVATRSFGVGAFWAAAVAVIAVFGAASALLRAVRAAIGGGRG